MSDLKLFTVNFHSITKGFIFGIIGNHIIWYHANIIDEIHERSTNFIFSMVRITMCITFTIGKYLTTNIVADRFCLTKQCIVIKIAPEYREYQVIKRCFVFSII